MKIASTNVAIIATLLLTAAPLAAQAQIMKCVDKNGRVEFAAFCPSGTRQQDTGVVTKPAPAPAPAAASKEGTKDAKSSDAPKDAKGPAAPQSIADRDAAFRKRQADQKAADDKAAKKSAEDVDRTRACQSAQSNLQALKNRQRMYRSDPKSGERIVYEEADYQREIPQMELTVSANCKA